MRLKNVSIFNMTNIAIMFDRLPTEIVRAYSTAAHDILLKICQHCKASIWFMFKVLWIVLWSKLRYILRVLIGFLPEPSSTSFYFWLIVDLSWKTYSVPKYHLILIHWGVGAIHLRRCSGLLIVLSIRYYRWSDQFWESVCLSLASYERRYVQCIITEMVLYPIHCRF